MGEFVSVGYKKKLGEAKNHVKYIAFRERSDGKNYGLFNDRSSNISVNDFCKKLDDKKISHSDIAKIHTVMFSMSGDEWERSGFIEEDYKKMVRNIMEDWQLKNGKRIDWVGAVHFEEGHPHVHIAIKSTYKDRDGIERRLNMNVKEEREWFRGQFREEKDAIRGPGWYEQEQERRRQMRRSKTRENGIGGNFIKNLFNQIKMRQLEAEHEREVEQLRAQRRAGRNR